MRISPDGYRPDVDGLRAIAILAVVLYHAHVPGFEGGYVGVDVFFVISGYLIIGLLTREFEKTGTLSLAGFFERRIRRLAPALVIVLAATLALGAIFLTPINGEQQGLAKSAIATMALVSNLYFARHTGGYFDGPAETQPLLHTWSLSVEEQFYLFWPLVVLAAGRFALRRGRNPVHLIAVALVVLLVVSFGASLVWTENDPGGAFYASPARAWEFALGGLVFFGLRRWPTMNRFGEVLAALGLLAIGAAVTQYEVSMAFPGYAAVLPVVGSAAVIVGCAQSPQGWAARCLSFPPVVLVGLISYSWYLWHWPMISIGRVHTLDEIGPAGISSLVVLSLLLAIVTWRYVETPIRSRRVMLMSTRRYAYAGAAAGACCIVVAAGLLGGYAKYAWPELGGNQSLRLALSETRKVRMYCEQPRPETVALLNRPDCNLPGGNGPPRLLLWGDSHAAHLGPMLGSLATEQGANVRIRYMSECPPLQDYSPSVIGVHRSPGCAQFNRDVLDEIASLRRAGLDTVVLAARWPAYLSNPQALVAADHGLHATLDGLRDLGARVLIAAPVPEFPHVVPACLVRRSPVECGRDRVWVDRQREPVLRFLEDVRRPFPEVEILDPVPVLCDSGFCPAIADDVILFSDVHHLSEAGSMALRTLYAPYVRNAQTGKFAGTSAAVAPSSERR